MPAAKGFTPTFRSFRRWMMDTQGFETGFQLGMIRDEERYRIPPGGSYLLQDFLVDNPGKMRKRGGTIYQSSGVTPTGSTGGPIFVAVMCPEFNSFDPRILGIASNGAAGRTLYDLTGGTAGPEIAIGVQPYENPTIMESNGQTYVIVTDGQNHGVPKKITRPGAFGTTVTVGSLTSSGTKPDGTAADAVPHGTVSSSIGPYLILANDGASHQNRIWYGPGGNNIEGAWDTINMWEDLSDPVIAMANHGGVQLVWTRRELWRVLGDTPPGVSGSDGNSISNMQYQSVAKVGCIDARSVCAGTNGVYFANENGIYVTDGASTTSLTQTKDNQFATYWQSLMGQFSVELGHVVAGVVYRDTWLFMTVTKVGVSSNTVACYLPTNSWTVVTGTMNSLMSATSLATDALQDDVYFCNPFSAAGGTCRLVRGAGILTPTSVNMNDADGTPIQPLWISRVIPGASTSLKRFGNGRLIYRMTGGTPQLHITMITGLQAEANSVEVHEGSPVGLSDAGDVERSRFRLYKDAEGITLQVQQVGASAETEILGVEYELGVFFQAEEEGN